MKDFYELLSGHGMVLGKIFPNHVAFKDYEHRDEDFYGPNYLAVHQTHGALINALKG